MHPELNHVSWLRSWPTMDDNRGKVLFVLVDSMGKYGPMYRQQFPDLRNATFFVSQPGEQSYLHTALFI